MFKKRFLLFFLLSCLILPVFSEQITKIAVVDLTKVKSVYYDDTYLMKEIEKRKKEFQEEIIQIDGEIKKLEEKKADAEKKGDDVRVLELESQIEQKKNYLKEFIKVKNEQLNNLNNRAMQQLKMDEEITDAIKFIQESKGYSLVFDSADPYLIMWNHDVDITDDVLQYLLRNRKE